MQAIIAPVVIAEVRGNNFGFSLTPLDELQTANKL